MKHLTILVPAGDNNISSIAGAWKVLGRANTIWKESGRTPPFRIELAGLTAETEFHDGLFAIRPHITIDRLRKTDLIIIPSLNHQYEKALRLNDRLLPWIKDRHSEGAVIASICTGAFLLAATGLLDGRSCATHWSAAEAFRQRFPLVRLCADQLITDEAGLLTNGGAYSFLNLLLYLVEKYWDRPTAIRCAKQFQIDPDRASQSPFAIFTGQKQHGDDLIARVQEYLEDRIAEPIVFSMIADRFAIGRRSLDRRFTRATGNSPAEYLQRLRVEAAKKKLELTDAAVSEVMYAVGYTDPKAFRELFRRHTALSPQGYRARFGHSSRANAPA